MKTYRVTLRGGEVQMIKADWVVRGDAWLTFRVGKRNVGRFLAGTTSCREIKAEEPKRKA